MSEVDKSNVHIAILAGGQGTRFWPVSRKDKPKQFLSVCNSGESLIQATARRVEALHEAGGLHVVSNVAHTPLLKEHVPEANLIIEPLARNTAAAIGLAAIKIQHNLQHDPVVVCLPADHTVKDEGALVATLADAITVASEQDALVTIGIQPSEPNTAYGYIKRGDKKTSTSYAVARFYEKPNIERAKTYFSSGEFYWNSGMFVWRASVILKAIAEFMPDLSTALQRIKERIGTPEEENVIAKEFEKLESISIDFGVLEHAKNCMVVHAREFAWNDVGSWDAWSDQFSKDARGNVVKGEALLIDSRDCVVHAMDKKIAVLGANDLVVIDSGDALLVCPRDKVQDVKKIVVELQSQGREDLT